MDGNHDLPMTIDPAFLVSRLLGRQPLVPPLLAAQVLHSFFGVMLVYYHGIHKLVDGLEWRGGRRAEWPFVAEIKAAGFPFPVINAWFATAAQLVGGSLLVLGLGTRPAALLIIGTLLGAVYTNVVLKKSNQMALLYLLLAVCVLAFGPGVWSMDLAFFG